MERYRRLEIESRLKVPNFLRGGGAVAAAAKLDKMILEDDFLLETPPPPRFFSEIADGDCIEMEKKLRH